MDNVYSQSEFKRNSIVELPDGFAENAGNTLYSWLGSIWRGLHQGDDMVRGLQKARGMRLAQLYLNILEAAKLQDRNGAPVFHRELWHPIVVRKSQRDKANENMLNAGDGIYIGPYNGEYRDVTLKMGKLAEYEKYVTYPIDESVVGMAASVVDNIFNPTVSMEHGVDFVFRNNTIVIPRESDPLAADSPFEKFDIPGDDPENPDIECVLWASDVFVDKNYVSDHISYALGADAPSSDVVKRILNAAWDALTGGMSPEFAKALMAAMLNIPVIQSANETVVELGEEKDDDGNLLARLVVTDKGTYRVTPKAKLRRNVRPGAKLVRGDLLDESLRIYSGLNGISVSAASDSGGVGLDVSYRDTGYSVPLEQDIASVVLPRDVLRVKTEFGLYAMWGAETVKLSSDGNPNHLYFDVGGIPSDVRAFWTDIWDRADAARVDLSTIVGNAGDVVSPAAFFLKNLVGANTLFVVVDAAQLDDPSKMHDPMFFGMLSSAVPASMRMFVVEHHAVEDKTDMGEARESTFLAAALPVVEEHVPYAPFPGLDGRGPTLGDHVSARFVRPSPPKIKGRKEEQ